MRVLKQVSSAEFDIPSETFAVELAPGADVAPVLAAIQDLGYSPALVEEPPARTEQIERLAEPTSPALRDALARARTRGVPLVVDFGGPFCRLCRVFEETTLVDARVRELLADFEFLKVDVEQDEAAARDLDVHGVPDIWVLGADGAVLARHNGFLDPEQFAKFIEGVSR